MSTDEVPYLKTLVEFQQALTDAGSALVVVDFTASWCGPCKAIAPKFKAMMAEFPDVKFFKVDVDANDETSEKEGIQAMPTFKFYRNGANIPGVTVKGASEEKLRSTIESERLK